ncbi:MAG: F390 synthetase-related protein [Arachnia sp.]
MSRLRIVAAFASQRWRRRFASRASLERFQRHSWRRQLRFLRAHSPRFSHAPETLAAFPLMDKASMMADFDRLNTAGLRLGDVTATALRAEGARDVSATMGDIAVGLSSGTSGHRGVFVTSSAERDEWAGTVLAMTLPRGRRLWGHRIALFLRAGNPLYETVRSRAIDFRFYDTHGDIGRHARDLAAYQPTILVAPASVLDVLAHHTPGMCPEKVYSVAEVLPEADASRLAAAFRVPRIHQLYQCTEGLLGRTCEHGVLHLNEEIAIVETEWLDEHRFVPIITDLRRRTQPIIRYRLNDVLVKRTAPCPCGSVLMALERIEGRQDDTLLIDGRSVFPDHHPSDPHGRGLHRVPGEANR